MEQESAAKDVAVAFHQAMEKLVSKGTRKKALLDSLQQQLAAGMAETSLNTQATLLASPARLPRPNGYAHYAVGTQQEQARQKGTSSERTHAQRSSSRSVTSEPADSAHHLPEAPMAEQATQPAAEPEDNMDADGAHPLDEEPTAAQWHTKLPQIAEASAECNVNSAGGQHVSFAKHAFKDAQGTLEMPSLFQQGAGTLQTSTAAASQEKLPASNAQPAGEGETAEKEPAGSGSPTANRENVPVNHTAPFSQSQGKPAVAPEDPGTPLRLSLQGAGGPGGPEQHGEEWDDMD